MVLVSVANSSLNFSITLSFKLYRDLKVTLKATLPKLEADTLSCKAPSQLTKNEIILAQRTPVES